MVKFLYQIALFIHSTDALQCVSTSNASQQQDLVTLTNRQFDELRYLAEEIEQGDNFEADLRLFARLSKALEQDIYDQVYDVEALRVLSRLQPIKAEEEKRTIWNTVLPKSSFGMYDRYQKKEHFREQVREAAAIFARIQDLLADDLMN